MRKNLLHALSGTNVFKSILKCPEAVRNLGAHIAMMYYEGGTKYWNYQAIRDAIND